MKEQGKNPPDQTTNKTGTQSHSLKKKKREMAKKYVTDEGAR